jgi:hypothetical protein
MPHFPLLLALTLAACSRSSAPTPAPTPTPTPTPTLACRSLAIRTTEAQSLFGPDVHLATVDGTFPISPTA